MIVYRRPRLVASQLRVPLAVLLEHCERGEIRCPRCLEWKVAAENFWTNAGSPTGYTSRCRECARKPKTPRPVVRRPRRDTRPCDYCGERLYANSGAQIRLEGRTYRVHDACVGRAREYVYGEPMRDPIGETCGLD